MGNKSKVLLAFVIIVLLIGKAVYYVFETSNSNKANLAAALEITEIPRDYPYNVPSPLPYNYLYITGSVVNIGKATAFNAGLRVVAYDVDGILEINMTVPLGYETFGSDAATDVYVSSSYGNSSLKLESLYSGQNVTIEVGIFHEGVVSNWTILPMWTNSP